MTIKDLLQGVNAEEQLRILAVADTLIQSVGRYYGGSLTAAEIAALAKPSGRHDR